MLDDAESEAELPGENTAMLRKGGGDAEIVEIAMGQPGDIDEQPVTEALPPDVEVPIERTPPSPPVVEAGAEPEPPSPPMIESGQEREPVDPPDVEAGVELEPPNPPELNMDAPAPVLLDVDPLPTERVVDAPGIQGFPEWEPPVPKPDPEWPEELMRFDPPEFEDPEEDTVGMLLDEQAWKSMLLDRGNL